MHDELIIKKELEDMLSWANRPLQQFPKSERHVLAAEIRCTLYQLLRLVITANKRYHKKTTLAELDIELDVLRVQIRTAQGLGFLKFKDYENWAKRITVIGNLLGGWIKWSQVVQQAVFTVLEGIYEPIFISDSYACRVGRGTHKAADKAQSMLKECLVAHGRVFALKADISKFFASINHAALLEILSRKVADKRMMNLVTDIVSSYSEPNTPGVGIPIGNLTSQLFANVYMNELDHWMKHRNQVKGYVRYMDDFIVVHHDKDYLRALLLNAQKFLGDNLGLATNHKTQIFPVAVHKGRGLDFVGFHLWPHKRRLRKSAVSRISKNLRRLHKGYCAGQIDAKTVKSKIISYSNHAKAGDGLPLMQSKLNKLNFTRSQSW